MKTGFLRYCGALLRHPVVLCLISFSVCFVLALLLFFPLAPVARLLELQAEKQGIVLQIAAPQLLFPPGLGAAEVQLSHVQLPHPPFLLKNVVVRPLWLSLAGNNPGLAFDFVGYQGVISGTASRDGTLQASFSQLQISEPLSPQLPLLLSGELTSGEFAGVLPLVGQNRSRLQLEMSGLGLTGMQSLGGSSDLLPLGNLSASVEATGPLLQLNNLRVSGPAFDLKGSGSLRLGRTASNSSLNLSLELIPKDAFDPALKDLLGLLNSSQPDGSYRLSLRGALSKLRVQ